MATDSRTSKEPDGGFRWSFDEIRNIFVRTRASGEQRGSSTGSFHWSLSGTLEAIRSRFSSNRSLADKSLNADQINDGTNNKRIRREPEAIDKETRREMGRETRKGKSEKEKDRRNNVNNLFYTLGGLLGMEPGVKNKTQILSNAKDLLEQSSRDVQADNGS